MQFRNLDTLLLSEIRDHVERQFGYRPCLWQIRVVQALLKRDKDIVSVSPTGSGKTLTFWMPLLFVPHGVQIVVTPLNILGKQNVDALAKVGINAVSVTADTATSATFQAITDGKYRAIVTNIETLSKEGGGFEKLWLNKEFMAKVITITWDESQCVSKWGEFRPEYKTAGNLRHLIPRSIPFYITSATLPPRVLTDVMSTLGMHVDKSYIFLRSNDRLNVHLVIRKMKYPLNSFKDLAFLIPDDWDPTQPLPYKFVIFFDKISDSLDAAAYLRLRLPLQLRGKVKWFNSEMSTEFRDEESARFKEGKNFGLACTESFGMGVDLPDISLVIQWKASCDLCTLWQRFGRGARGLGHEATVLFLVEPMYFDDVKAQKASNKIKKSAAAASCKRKQMDANEPQHPNKKGRIDPALLAGSSALTPPNSHAVNRHVESPASVLERLRATLISTSMLSRQPVFSNVSSSILPPNTVADTNEVQEDSGLDKEDIEQHDEVTSDEDEEEEVSKDAEGDTWEETQATNPTDTAALTERRALYAAEGGKRRFEKKGKRKKDGNELEPAMDDLINAGAPGRVFTCSRAPVSLFFRNNETESDHLACRTDLPAGCPRCVASLPTVCCEKCTPAYFEHFARVDIEKPRPVPARSRLKDYIAGAEDMNLRDALHTYRKQATEVKFGRACLKNMGPGVIMSNEVLQRLVDSAHEYKIQNTADLVKETRWAGAHEHAAEIISLIQTHCPKPTLQPALTSTPLRSQASSSNQASGPPLQPRVFKSRKCSKCGSLGHIASNRSCPLHQSHLATTSSLTHHTIPAHKENVPPAAPSPRLMSAFDVITPDNFYSR